MVRKDDFVWLLGSLCQVLRLPFDARLVEQAFPPPYGRARMLAAIGELNMRVGEAAGCPQASTPMPCVAFLRASSGPTSGLTMDGSAAHEAAGDREGATRTVVPALVFKSEGGRVLFFTPRSDQPVIVTTDEFKSRFEPGYLLVARNAPSSAHAEKEGAPLATPKFGFRWFLPELLKHKGIWQQVLLASLAIQLVGL